VPLLQLTNAYRALANGGQLTPVRGTSVQARAEAPVQAIDARAAFIVGDILSDPIARAPTFGTASVLATRSWTAVKTGTSKDMRDNWAVGWSQRYTVGVWVGNARGDAMHSVSGTSGAAPVWAAVMGFLHASTPSRAPKAPAGVLQQAVRFGPDASGLPLESARSEWFVAGTQQSLFAMAGSGLPAASSSARGTSAASPVRIARPANGTILALDPDIPPDRQRVQLSARPAGTAATQEWQDASLRWRMVSAAPPGAAEPAPKDIGRGAAAAWLPWPGRHRLELVDAKGQVLDSVQVEVRGAGVVASRAGGR
jgi:penicillin-binding protein 1C